MPPFGFNMQRNADREFIAAPQENVARLSKYSPQAHIVTIGNIRNAVNGRLSAHNADGVLKIGGDGVLELQRVVDHAVDAGVPLPQEVLHRDRIC